MNITKCLLLILISFLSTKSFTQNTTKLDCENGFEKIETKVKSQEIVSYKIVFSRRLFTEESSDFYEGFVVLSDLNDQISPKEIVETIARIGVKNKLNKIVAFKTCKAVEIYRMQP